MTNRHSSRTRAALVLAACGSFIAPASSPAAFLTFLDGVGTPTSANVTPGGSATFTIALQSDDASFAGLSLYLQDDAYASAPTVRFTISERVTLAGSNPFSTAVTSGAISGDPVDNQTLDLGYYNGSNIAPGRYELMTVTVTASEGLTPGSSFTISSTPASALFNLAEAEIPLTAATYTLNVVPVPEPAAPLTLAGLSALAFTRRRRPASAQ
jgi:MYXO-CTERM domain-containing protein